LINKCNVCGKNLINNNGKTYIGCSFIVSCDNKDDSLYLQEQMGEYKLGKSYDICFECRFKSLNIKP
jgi:ssDNA-binding Zn-finger/Zn-ribbon topoisomerase 1